MGRRIVNFWNAITRIRRSRCRPEGLLILFPSCLQFSGCPQKITYDLGQCKRCGRCKVKGILELSEKYGTRCAVATGGRLALEIAKSDGVEAVVAVACEKELQEGIKALFPKPSIGVPNLRPHGPCKDTDVDLEQVEEAVRWFLRAQ